MTHYLTKEEVFAEFDEKFVNNTVKIGETLWIQHIDAIPKTHSHISQIRQNDLKGLQEWAESKKRREYFKMSIHGIDDRDSKEKAFDKGYNQALTDYQKYLSSLNQ